MKNEMIHVCYAIHDEKGSYCKFLGASLCSMLENTEANITVHIIHDETLSQENRSLLTKMTGNYGQSICFYHADLRSRLSFYEEISNSIYSVAICYRFLIPELLGDEIKKIIYLDADTIVNLDILSLWKEKMGEGYAVAAVRDAAGINLERESTEARLGRYMDVKDYFNSGVLIMNLAYIRSLGKGYLLHMTNELLKVHKDWRYFDQDVLNYLFHDKCLFLPACYNHLTVMPDYRDCKEPLSLRMICHYVHINLNVRTNNAFDYIFWHYFLKTPWCSAGFLMKAFQCGYFLMDRQLEYIRHFWMVFHGKPKHIYYGNGDSERSIRMVFPFAENDEYIYEENEAEMSAKIAEMRPEDTMLVLFTDDYFKWHRYLCQKGYREEADFFDGRSMFTPSEGGVCHRSIQEYIYGYIRDM